MHVVQVQGLSFESSPEQDWKLMVDQKQGLKPKDLANGDTKEQPSSEVRGVERHGRELKRLPLKTPLLLLLPSGQAPVREELELGQLEEVVEEGEE